MTPEDDWSQAQQCWEAEFEAWEQAQDDEFNLEMSVPDENE